MPSVDNPFKSPPTRATTRSEFDPRAWLPLAIWLLGLSACPVMFAAERIFSLGIPANAGFLWLLLGFGVSCLAIVLTPLHVLVKIAVAAGTLVLHLAVIAITTVIDIILFGFSPEMFS